MGLAKGVILIKALIMNLLPGTSRALTALALLVSLTTASSTSTPTTSPNPSTQTGPSPNGFDITKSWSNLTPYKDADFGLPKGSPHGCELSQAHVLHRHAERFPSSGPLDADGMENFHAKIANYTKAHPGASVGRGPLAFLNEWRYLLGRDLLVDSGAATEVKAGADFWGRYGRLLYRVQPGDGIGLAAWEPGLNKYLDGAARPKPVFRTTGKERILESARWWLSGFFGNVGANNSYSQYDLVVIPESKGFNNTLASTKSCPNNHNIGEQAATTFINQTTQKALSRLSPYLPQNITLTPTDIHSMQNLCPYETATLGTTSPFCTLFTEQEWLDYAYSNDLKYYADYAFGAPAGRAYGIGYVLELAARLQPTLIKASDTSVNASLDGDGEAFPLGQPFYMDMSHEHVIISVLTALGLDFFRYGADGRLPDSVDHAIPHTFQLGNMTPFGSRLISEIWTCPSNITNTSIFNTKNLTPTLYSNPTLSNTTNTKSYIRFVLNNAPLPLTGLPGCETQSKNGFCPVETFLRAVPALKRDAVYQEACFGDYGVKGQVGDGRPEVV